MRIEIREAGSEAFYKETINVLIQYRSLIKKPERTLTDYFKTVKRYEIISALLFVLLGATTVLWGAGKATLMAMGLMAVNLVFCRIYLINIGKLYREMREDTRSSVLTLDENGVELDKESSQIVRISWENVAFLRVFREAVCILPRNATGFVISVSRFYEEEILGYLKEHGTEIRIIEA